MFVLSFYSNYYYCNWTRGCLMVSGFYIYLYIFVQHLKSEKRSLHDNKSIDINFLYSIVLNMCSLWWGAICFGNPCLPVSVYTCDIFLMVVIWSINVSSKYGVYKIRAFNEIPVLIFKPRISDYANREYQPYWVDWWCSRKVGTQLRSGICFKLEIYKLQI